MEGVKPPPAEDQITDCWIVPSSSGNLVPQRHRQVSQETAGPKQRDIRSFLLPKCCDTPTAEPEPEGAPDKPIRLVKLHSSSAASLRKKQEVRAKRSLSARQIKPANEVSTAAERRLQELRVKRNQSVRQLCPSVGVHSPTDRDTAAEALDGSDGESIKSEPRSPDSLTDLVDSDNSFIVSDDETPVTTAGLGYNYLDTGASHHTGYSGAIIEQAYPSPAGEPIENSILEKNSYPVVSPQSALLQAAEDTAVSYFQHTLCIGNHGDCACAVCTKPIAWITVTACFKDGTGAPIVFCGTCCTSPCNCVCAFCDHTKPQCQCRHHGSQVPQ
eukprot:COSAG01_NODE_2090_length_8453_cov_554.144721_4_plen_329_part_00